MICVWFFSCVYLWPFFICQGAQLNRGTTKLGQSTMFHISPMSSSRLPVTRSFPIPPISLLTELGYPITKLSEIHSIPTVVLFLTKVASRVFRSSPFRSFSRSSHLSGSPGKPPTIPIKVLHLNNFPDPAPLSMCHSGQSPLSHIFRVDRTRAAVSPDGDCGAFPDQRVKSGGIPVR